MRTNLALILGAFCATLAVGTAMKLAAPAVWHSFVFIMIGGAE